MSSRKKDEKATALQNAAKALAHPLRVAILEEMANGETSPNRLAEALDEPLGNVSYHVKTLLEYEAVELSKTEPRRGAVEHFYKRTGKVLPTKDARLALTRSDDALDRITAAVQGKGEPESTARARLNEVREILRGTGREV